MDDFETLLRLALALSIGLLLGLERGWKERGAHGGSRVAGVRTFALISTLGALWALLAEDIGAVLLSIAFLGLALVMITAHVLSALHDRDYGITTTIAALLTFALGAAAMRFEPILVSSVAVVIVTVLGLKPILHRWVRRLQRRDLYAIFQMLLISVVLLPVLPNETLGALGGINPYELWLLVVLTAGVSFTGYFAIKVFGQRLGLGLTSAFGGLVSSTAVTLSFARMARSTPENHRILTAGVLVAAGTMFPRTLLLAAILNPTLARQLMPPLIAMALICYSAAAWFWHKADANAGLEQEAPRNPLELKSAVIFGSLLAAVVVLARVLRDWLGDAGVYLLGALSGIADVDAVTLSVSRMTPGELPVVVAGGAIVVATLVNTVAKGCIAIGVARSRMGWQVFGALVWVAIAGALVSLLSLRSVIEP